MKLECQKNTHHVLIIIIEIISLNLQFGTLQKLPTIIPIPRLQTSTKEDECLKTFVFISG